MNKPDRKLLEILVCPKDKSKLKLSDDKTELICSNCNNKYLIKNGIPVMLLPEIQTQSK
jgi:uncharacterized protein YbaR (Trm112 family)